MLEAFSYRDEEATPRKDTDAVAVAMEYFDEKQMLSSDKPIPARDVLIQRLEALRAGEPVEIVCFNCIDFNYKARGGNYPEASAINDTTNALVECFREEFLETAAQLRKLGNPTITIIVPDSELTDTRVFNFGQKEKDRVAIGQQLQQGLSERFADQGISVMLWSDFLQSRGLPTPRDYTDRNLPLVMDQYRSSLKRAANDSPAYFITKGISADQIGQVSESEMTIRTAWYTAMYAGEGNAMADLRNPIMLNFENDGKVLVWSQRGAQGYTSKQEVLPIVTPADTRRFKPWKDSLQRAKNVVFDRMIKR